VKTNKELTKEIANCNRCKNIGRKQGRLATLKEVLKEAKELKHFNEVAEQGKYPEWLRGYNTAVDSIIEYCNTKIKEVKKGKKTWVKFKTSYGWVAFKAKIKEVEK
jgi:hypothetical protein